MKRFFTTLSLGVLMGAPVFATQDNKAIDAALETILARLEAGVQSQEFAQEDWRALHQALKQRIDKANAEDPAGAQVRTGITKLAQDLQAAGADERYEIIVDDFVDLREEIITADLRRYIRRWRDLIAAGKGSTDYTRIVGLLQERYENTKTTSQLAKHHMASARMIADDIQARTSAKATEPVDFDLLDEKVVDQRLARVIDALRRWTLAGRIQRQHFDRWQALFTDRVGFEKPYYVDAELDGKALKISGASIRDMAVAGSANAKTFQQMQCEVVTMRLRRAITALEQRAPKGVTPAWWTDIRTIIDERMPCSVTKANKKLDMDIRAEVERVEKIAQTRALTPDDFQRLRDYRELLIGRTASAGFQKK